jgi:hypothetical protein
MIVMSEREFRMMVQDWVGMLDDEERENTEALHEALRESSSGKATWVAIRPNSFGSRTQKLSLSTHSRKQA